MLNLKETELHTSIKHIGKFGIPPIPLVHTADGNQVTLSHLAKKIILSFQGTSGSRSIQPLVVWTTIGLSSNTKKNLFSKFFTTSDLFYEYLKNDSPHVWIGKYIDLPTKTILAIDFPVCQNYDIV